MLFSCIIPSSLFLRRLLGQLFMALHLVILPLYCFLSELLSRIRQLAYHQVMIYRIYK